MSRGDQQQKIRLWRQRMDAAPHSRAFAPLADALRQAGHHKEALTLLEDGLARHPEYQAARVILGRTLLDTGRSERAGEVLRGVLENDGENVVALRLLTENARSRQAWREVVPLLEKLSVLDPDDERWPQALSEARRNQSIPLAADVPETSFATMTLVEIYLAQGYRSKALTALHRMREREPGRQDIADKIAEISITRAPGTGKADRVAEAEEADMESGAGGRSDLQAAKRARDKKAFEAWVERLRADESATP